MGWKKLRSVSVSPQSDRYQRYDNLVTEFLIDALHKRKIQLVRTVFMDNYVKAWEQNPEKGEM